MSARNVHLLPNAMVIPVASIQGTFQLMPENGSGIMRICCPWGEGEFTIPPELGNKILELLEQAKEIA